MRVFTKFIACTFNKRFNKHFNMKLFFWRFPRILNQVLWNSILLTSVWIFNTELFFFSKKKYSIFQGFFFFFFNSLYFIRHTVVEYFLSSNHSRLIANELWTIFVGKAPLKILFENHWNKDINLICWKKKKPSI